MMFFLSSVLKFAKTIRSSLLLLPLIGLPSLSPAAEPLTTIPAIDVPRYMGTWYEIAKYPNRFQKQCVSDTTAEYVLNADRSVTVTNRCRIASGTIETAVGKARQLGAADSAKLEVRFAPAWLSFLPAVWGSYWVIDLDPAYQLAAVSEPSREYLWILSRTPKLPQQQYDALLQALARKGFDLSRLQMSPQLGQKAGE